MAALRGCCHFQGGCQMVVQQIFISNFGVRFCRYGSARYTAVMNLLGQGCAGDCFSCVGQVVQSAYWCGSSVWAACYAFSDCLMGVTTYCAAHSYWKHSLWAQPDQMHQAHFPISRPHNLAGEQWLERASQQRQCCACGDNPLRLFCHRILLCIM
jgi:hypothetical protein